MTCLCFIDTFTYTNRAYIHPLTSFSNLPAPPNHTSKHEEQRKSLKTLVVLAKQLSL